MKNNISIKQIEDSIFNEVLKLVSDIGKYEVTNRDIIKFLINKIAIILFEMHSINEQIIILKKENLNVRKKITKT